MALLTEDPEEQRKYYARAGGSYAAPSHTSVPSAHQVALGFLFSALEDLGVRSVLDVGSGVGVALRAIAERNPAIRVVGVEASPVLREQAYARGVSRDTLVEGDPAELPFDTRSFDLVCAFGALHQLVRPRPAVAEMLRVARLAVFISDQDYFGQGTPPERALKRLINAVGLWPVADKVLSRTRRQAAVDPSVSLPGYSVFNDYGYVRRRCERVHLLSTESGGMTSYRSSCHVAVLGVKRAEHG